jgi:membrane-bound lytic murein transglycosylase MltF
MKINVNHTATISYLEHLNKNVLSNIILDKYFSLSKDKKIGIQYLTLKLIKKYLGIRTKLSNGDLLELIKVLQKNNEDLENYEFASTLKDIITNFDLIINLSEPLPKQKKTIKTEKKSNE